VAYLHLPTNKTERFDLIAFVKKVTAYFSDVIEAYPLLKKRRN
jgi:hypothetical protein